jgi:hypothetical protein
MPYWKLFLISGIPWTIALVIIIVGVYEHSGDLMPYVLSLTFKTLAVCIFFKGIIECGWWWSVVTSMYEKFPDLVGDKILRIKCCIGLYFFVFLFFAMALYLNLIFYLLAFKTIAIILVVILCLLSVICVLSLRSFLIKMLKEISRKYYNDTIDGFIFSPFNPLGTWSVQKVLNEIFKQV